MRITWAEVADDFDLIILRGHVRPDFLAPICKDDLKTQCEIDRSEQRGTTSESVLIRDAEPGEYTIRVNYTAVVDSGYSGSASFLDGSVRHDGAELEFGPATIVSAHFLGTEPMVTMERRIAGLSESGAIDRDRIFVDWPLTPRGQIGQVSRSLDGGKSFRLLFDPDCPERSRPGCLMGGGSDTMTEVDLIDGTLYFADQAAVIGAESLAISTDHGDTFERQFAITSQITATDRQWLAPVNGLDLRVPDQEEASSVARKVKAFLAYHVPLEGQYIHGIDEEGVPLPQPVPQLTQVLQSGHPRVDTSLESPGSGWIYQPYLDFGATDGIVVKVATARGRDYQIPTAWEATTITDISTISFPWLDIDSEGNAYLVWVTGDVDDESVRPAVYFSASPIADDRNNPVVGGRPGTYWTPQARLSPPKVNSAVFAEVVAGGPGRIAVSYLGTDHTGFAGLPDHAFSGVEWHAYAAVVTNALGGWHEHDPKPGEDGPPIVPPIVHTGRVSDRVVHDGQICTAGTSCTTADRSLADMIDIGVDEDGRIGVVFADNNNSLPWQNESEQARPFAHFAKLSSGPSLFLFEDKPPIIDVAPPVDGADEPGDATWPNIAYADDLPANLPAVDLLGADLALEDGQIVARLELKDASPRALQEALESFEATTSTSQPAERLHYMVRFSTADDVYHLSMDYRPPTGSQTEGMTRFFGGRLDANDALRVGDSDSLTLVGAAYRSDENIEVEEPIDHETDTLVISAPAAAFCAADGEDFCGSHPTKVFSVTGFTMAGPAEEDVALINPMRTVDATPPFDAILAVEPPKPPTLAFTPPSDVRGQHSDEATFTIELRNGDGDPIANATIDFTFVGLAGPRSSTGFTDANGIATTTVELVDAAGAAEMTATYVDPAGIFEPSTAVWSFDIEREVTMLDLEVSGRGSRARLIATLLDDDGSAVSGKTIALSADGKAICSGGPPTDAYGVISCDLPPRYRGGHHLFEALFSDDYFHVGAAAQEQT